MYYTTNFPDGRRQVDTPGPGENPDAYAWAVVIRGRKELGHITGPAWRLHRYEPTQDLARDTARTLERTCSVEHAVVLPTAPHPAGASWTAIGFWDGDEVQLVAIVPGDLEPAGGEDVSVGGTWSAAVWAPTVEAATVEAYRCMDESVADLKAHQEPLFGA